VSRLRITAVILALCGASLCPAQLREQAEKDGLLVGAATRPDQLHETAYAATLAREYNLLEAEDAMKWWVLRPNSETYDFSQGDEVIRFARAHQMKVRGHCLVWGRTLPEWLAHGQLNDAQLSQLLHEHIQKVMQHYGGKVFAWDVVNEAIDENGRLRDSLWYNQPGIGLAGKGAAYIEQAFRWAHEADPQALLFYNDAEAEELNRKSDAIYEMVKDFKKRGVPIDGVGLQMHVPALHVDARSLSANIARLSALGLQVHITELDVSLPLETNASLQLDHLATQAAVYRDIVRACLIAPGCTAIQTWGFTDKYSWINSHSRGTRGQALLFDREYHAKPAYRAVMDELAAGRSRSR